MSQPSYVGFDKAKYRRQLRTYSIKGEVGVLSYKYSKKVSAFWRIRTYELAKHSAEQVYELFLDNIDGAKQYMHFVDDGVISKRLVKLFMKADICRKFLLMGYTRSMRYYRHKSGKKWDYDEDDNEWYELPRHYDPEKKQSAMIFKKYLDKALDNPVYQELVEYFQLLPNSAKGTADL